jgi:hypothetical protein
MEALAKQVGVEKTGNNQATFKAYSDFLSLIDDAENSVKSLPKYRSAYLTPIEKLKSILNIVNPYDTVQAIAARFTSQDVEHLATIVHVLDDQVGTLELNADELNQLKTKIFQIKEDILNSKMDSELKDMLFEGIQFLIEAIERHLINGDEGVRIAFDRFFGILKRKNKSYEKDDVFRTFAREILLLEPWLGRIADIYAVLDMGSKMLGGS